METGVWTLPMLTLDIGRSVLAFPVRLVYICPYCAGTLLDIEDPGIPLGAGNLPPETVTTARAALIELRLGAAATGHHCPRWHQRLRYRRLLRSVL